MLRELATLRRALPVRRLRARRAGCSCAIELVRDKKTQGAARRAGDRADLHRVRARAACSTMAYAPSFRIQPALTIDEATARNGLAILREVFDVVEREGLWRS